MNEHPLDLVRAASVAIFVLLAVTSPIAGEVAVFGPRTYVRPSGQTVTQRKPFRVQNAAHGYVARVANHGVADAWITFNGQLIFGPDDFSAAEKNGTTIQRSITPIIGDNTVDVLLEGVAGTSIDLTVLEVDGPASPAPIAIAGGPYNGRIGEFIAFSANGSTQGIYTWDFGDGATGSGFNSGHSYSASGIYTAALRVKDSAGRTASASAQVVVQGNRAPIVVAGGPYQGTAGQLIGFSAAGSIDPDGDIISYSWAFGDGVSGVNFSPGHSYSSAGTYTVTLTGSDMFGASGSASALVTVVAAPPPNRPPAANVGGPYVGTAQHAVQFSSSASSDPDGDSLSYAWDLGAGFITNQPSPSHTYVSPGTYTIVLTVSDQFGAQSTATTQATIGPDLSPVAHAGGPYTGNVSQPITLSALGSSDPENDTLQYQWDAGDGTLGTGSTLTHTYPMPGTYSVRLTVFDGHGNGANATTEAVIAGSGSQTHTLTVQQLGNSVGSVTSVPAGIDCGPTCFAAFARDLVVTLTASAPAGSVFAGWSGACINTAGVCNVSMGTDALVTARFNLQSTEAPAATAVTALKGQPQAIQSGVPTQVVVTATIAEDPRIDPSGIRLTRLSAVAGLNTDLGPMFDDGTNGDVTAGDHEFTAQLQLLETAPGLLTLRVSVPPAGDGEVAMSQPLLVPVTIPSTPLQSRIDLSDALRDGDLISAYRFLGNQLNLDLVLDPLNATELATIADALFGCEVVEGDLRFEVCVSRNALDGNEYRFFLVRDELGLWRILTW